MRKLVLFWLASLAGFIVDVGMNGRASHPIRAPLALSWCA
jgi:hypothetical protein